MRQVNWLDQADESARFIESEQRIYAHDDWLKPDPNEGVTGIVRLDDGEPHHPASYEHKMA